MDKFFIKVGLVIAVLFSASVQASDVGVSIQFGQPGFYGHLDLGGFQQAPQVIYREPRIVERVVVQRPPLYLMVPEGHSRHWEKHCYRYDACNRQVYFVQERWYNEVVVPRYREVRYRDDGYRNDYRNDYRNESRRYDDRDDDRGHGREHEHGRGHDRGHRDD
ncbi:MAG: hypothetical protein NTY70_18765 [Burkholderiales bacterium]|nr:hypothetical protein [Burkholderiales bacterium]